LASTEPIPRLTVEELIGKMPAAARADFIEWFRGKDLRKMLGPIVNSDIDMEKILSKDPSIRVTDDRPYNEYYLIRRLRDRAQGVAESFRSLPGALQKEM